jgi:hypothetical protein
VPCGKENFRIEWECLDLGVLGSFSETRRDILLFLGTLMESCEEVSLPESYSLFVVKLIEKFEPESSELFETVECFLVK